MRVRLPAHQPPLARHLHPQLLAPNEDAFDQLRINLGGGRPLPKDALYRLDQLRNILLYHIIPGAYHAGAQQRPCMARAHAPQHLLTPASCVNATACYAQRTCATTRPS